MVDTIAISPCWPLRYPLSHGTRNGPVQFKICSATNQLVWVQSSLPRLHFGTNTRTITSQSELDAAYGCLWSWLNQIAVVPSVEDWPMPSRLDLVAQWDSPQTFGVPVNALLLAHAGLCVPGIQEPAVRRRNSVTWKGCELVIMLYGKSRKHRLQQDILRAEVRFLRGQLCRRFQDRDWRQLTVQWDAYRAAMLSIPKICKPRLGGGVIEAVGRAVPVALHETFLAELSHKNPRTLRDYRRRMCIAAAGLPSNFSWAENLPEDAPPPPFHASAQSL